MAENKKKQTPHTKTVGLNRKASHNYFLEERLEAGLALEGWEVKSIRASQVQLVDSYVIFKEGQAWLFGMNVPMLPTTSKQTPVDPLRTRRLLLHRRQIDRLIGATEREGYTVVPTRLYFAKGKVKLEIALAEGKKLHDKRASEKDRDWNRTKSRLMRHKT